VIEARGLPQGLNAVTTRARSIRPRTAGQSSQSPLMNGGVDGTDCGLPGCAIFATFGTVNGVSGRLDWQTHRFLPRCKNGVRAINSRLALATPDDQGRMEAEGETVL
jgi:hypothetical protein